MKNCFTFVVDNSPHGQANEGSWYMYIKLNRRLLARERERKRARRAWTERGREVRDGSAVLSSFQQQSR